MMTFFTSFMEAMTNSKQRVIVTTTSVLCFWLFIFWSLGLVPAFGAGFARAEDVQSIQATLLENQIMEARIRYCSAPNGTQSKQFFHLTVNQKVNEYRELTGYAYPLPQCEELVVANVNP